MTFGKLTTDEKRSGCESVGGSMIASYLVIGLVIAQLVIAAAYAAAGDFPRLLYWLCAMGITLSTLGMK